MLFEVTEYWLRHVVAGISPRLTHWKITRAEARDYMLTETLWPNRELFNAPLGVG
jgi:hypothetical protein